MKKLINYLRNMKSSYLWKKFSMKRVISFISYFFISGLLISPISKSHPLAPSLLKIVEKEHGLLKVFWKEPELKKRGEKLRPFFQDGCEKNGPVKITYEGTGVVKKFDVICKKLSFVGQEVGVEGWNQVNSTVLLHITLNDGSIIQKVLSSDLKKIIVPKKDTLMVFFGKYLFLGMSHIFEGIDHLLFVLGLMILMNGFRKILISLTFFTLGHSITLSLATLEVVAFPSFLCEFFISLSLVFLVCEISKNKGNKGNKESKESLMIKYPGSMTTFFGLIHGLGFAGALKEVGLPSTEIPLTLFSFNLGIEFGQVLFVAVIICFWAALIKLKVELPSWLRNGSVHCMGILAGYWCFERIFIYMGNIVSS